MIKYAIILAGGTGSRMGGDLPKQFIEIEGKPILRHTIEKFQEADPEIRLVIVMKPEFKQQWKEYCNKTGFLEKYIMPSGGISRFHSVKNALEYVDNESIVAVHDGVRPFVSPEYIRSLFDRAEDCDALVPVLPVKESLRIVREDGSSESVDRKDYYSVQTPQVFKASVLKKAYEQPYLPTFTDDASVVEAAGFTVSLCEGLSENIKITVPSDLQHRG